MVEVPVIQRFTHEGRALSVGDTIQVSPLVAAALHRRGLVSLTKGYQAKVVTPEPETANPRRRRRGTYQRRDMTAETP